MNPDKPSDLELQILSVLWRGGPATVRDVLAALPDGKPRAYTSVLSIMQLMEKKGLLTRSREGVTDRWRPAKTQSRVLGPFLRRLVAHVFGGEPVEIMQHLLKETEIDHADLAVIRQVLDAHEQSLQTGAASHVKTKRKRP